ncbi:MAG: phosphoglycerate transporter [Dehalococcoidia bacterium]|nr:phosphoglycerate transporter [Dehalococcoidia bacterium]
MWEAIERGELDLRLRFVFCNRERGESEETDRFLDQVEGYGIPLSTLSFARFRAERSGRGMGLNHEAFADWRVQYDRAVIDLLPDQAPALVVLAGYMLVMTPELCGHFTCLNLHPAAPGGPVGTWQQVIWQLIESGAAESGIFMHLVTPELDRGPVVTYCRYPVVSPHTADGWRQAQDAAPGSLQTGYGEALPLFQQIRALGVARELPLILATLRAFGEGRIEVRDGRPWGAGGTPIDGIDLTGEIEAALPPARAETSADSLDR